MFGLDLLYVMSQMLVSTPSGRVPFLRHHLHKVGWPLCTGSPSEEEAN